MTRLLKIAFAPFTGILLSLVLLAGLPNTATSQVRAGSAYLKILPGTRQQSLGSSMTGALDGTFSLYANPGAAGLMRQWHLSGSYNKWIADIYNISLIGGRQFRAHLPWGDRFFGALGVNYQGLGNFDATGIAGASVSAQDLLLTASFGFPLTKVSRNLAFGFNVKYLRSELAQFNANALVFDTGLMYRTGRFKFPFLFKEGIFSIGGAVTQLGKSMTFITDGTPLPRTLRIGAALNVGEHDKVQLQLVSDYRKVRNEVSRVSLGAEISNFLSPLSPGLGRVLSFRGGYVFNSRQETSLVSKYSFGFSFRLDDYMNDLLHGQKRSVIPINTALRNDMGALGSSQYANVLQISSDLRPIAPESFDFDKSEYYSVDPEIAPVASYRICEPVNLTWQATHDPDLYDDVNYILLVGHEQNAMKVVISNARKNNMAPALRRDYSSESQDRGMTEVKVIELPSGPDSLSAAGATISAADVTRLRYRDSKQPMLSYTFVDESEPSAAHPVGTFYWTVLAYDRNGHYQVVGEPGRDIARFDIKPDPTLQLTITNTVPVADGFISDVIITNKGSFALDDSVLVQVAGIDSTDLVVEMPERLAGLNIDIDRTAGKSTIAPIDSLLEVRMPGIAEGQTRSIQVKWRKDYPYLIATLDAERRFLCEPVRDTLSLYDLRIEHLTEVPPLRPGVRFAFNQYRMNALEKGSRQKLDIIRAALMSEELSGAFVRLEGHSDQTGFKWNHHLAPADRKAADMRDNLNLSEKRIATVRSYLETGGNGHLDIDSTRFCAVGYGQEKPRPRSDLPKSIRAAFAIGRISPRRYQALVDSMDRRVEIYLLKKTVLCDRSRIPENVKMPVVMSGTEFNYKLRVSNDGPNAAVGVQLWDVVPGYLKIVEVDSLDGFQTRGDSLFWTAARLEVGETREVNLALRVADLPAGSIVRRITSRCGVTAPFDLRPQNNGAVADEIIAIGGRIDEISLLGNAADEPAHSGNSKTTHTVERGESLSLIAANYTRALGYRLTWRDIYHLNQITIGPYPNDVAQGLRLIIPGRTQRCSAGEQAPAVKSIRIEGKQREGQILAGTYIYASQHDLPEGRSRYRWLRNGRPIPGATAVTYQVTASDVSANLTFEVTPISSAQRCPVGLPAQARLETVARSSRDRSDTDESVRRLRADSVPRITEVAISGNCQVGDTLTGGYTFFDPDGDLEGSSLIGWLRNGHRIDGERRKEYEIQFEDVGSELILEVTPVDNRGTRGGAARSTPYKVPRRLLAGQRCGR